MSTADLLDPVEGLVTGVFQSDTYQVKLDNGHEATAHRSGKLRRSNIKVIIGDRVQVQLSPYDLQRGRIVYRLK